MTTPFGRPTRYPIWVCLLAPMLAGGLGWGIRGQYGHESGAMIPGVLIGLTIALLIAPAASGLRLARIAALTAVGFSFGASMTYGQTLGLSHDAGIREVGYWWGMLGTTVKGAIWVGLAGAFMGIGLSRRRYGAAELAIVLLVMIGLWLIGVWALNTPLAPVNQKLPRIYFSDYWNAGKPDWEPRMELWGGLSFALVGLLAYLAFIRRDGRAVAMTFFGLVAGGIGFTSGQSLQAYCAWHAPFPTAAIAKYIDAWKVMEVTFGLVVGLGTAIGCLVLYGRRDDAELEDEVTLSPVTEVVLFVLMADVMFLWNLRSYAAVDVVADVALTMGVIPIACIIGGRIWPYLGATVYIIIPIAGKTVRSAVYNEGVFEEGTGLTLLFRLPLLIMLVAGLVAMRRADRSATGSSSAGLMFFVSVWVFTLLSNANSFCRRALFCATDQRREEAGGWLGLVVESLRSALVVELTFFVLAVILTVLMARAMAKRSRSWTVSAMIETAR